MNPKELRIGNLIKDSGGKILTIDWFERTKICQKMEINGTEVHPFTEDFDFIQPIPLTEEWLLRFGFEYIGDGEYSLQLGRCRALLYGDDQMYLIYGEDAEATETIPCEFVHQFQNLFFALKGEELEIKQ